MERTGRVGLALSLVVATVGCKGKQQDGKATQGAPSGSAVGDKSVPQPAPTFSTAILPKDTAFVIGVSFRQVKASKLWDKYGPLVKEQLGELKAECGIDAEADVDSVLVAGDSTFDEKRMLLAIKGKWDESKGSACFAKLYKKKEGKEVAVSNQGKLTRYAIADSGDAYAYWMGDTVVVTPGAMADKSRLSALVSSSWSGQRNDALMELLKGVDTNGSMWGALVIPPSSWASETFGSNVVKPSSLFGTVHLAKTLDAKFGFVFSDDKQATDAADRWTQKIERAKSNAVFGPLVGNLKVAVAGSKTMVDVALDDKQMEHLLGLLELQFAGMLPKPDDKADGAN